MIKLIKRTMKAAKNYTIVDFGFLKILMLTFGLLIGIYFPKFFLNYAFFIWLVFIISLGWILYRTFFKDRV